MKIETFLLTAYLMPEKTLSSSSETGLDVSSLAVTFRQSQSKKGKVTWAVKRQTPSDLRILGS
eukprot:10558939-Ditylum_brightwellii.AAC.1